MWDCEGVHETDERWGTVEATDAFAKYYPVETTEIAQFYCRTAADTQGAGEEKVS
jgi:hypothetical protein